MEDTAAKNAGSPCLKKRKVVWRLILFVMWNILHLLQVRFNVKKCKPGMNRTRVDLVNIQPCKGWAVDEKELRGMFAIARQDRQCKDERHVPNSLYPTSASRSWNIFSTAKQGREFEACS